MYAGVIVNIDAPDVSQAFTYRVPEEMESAVSVGACVAVPFGGRELIGYILELSETSSVVSEIKDILAVVPDACSLNPDLLSLASWISDYYGASLSNSVRAIVPEMMSATISSVVRLVDSSRASDKSPNQQKILRILANLDGESDEHILKAKCAIDKFGPALRQLKERRAVEVVRSLELPKVRPLIVQGVQIIYDEDLPEIEELIARAPKQAALLKELAGTDGAVRQSELVKRVGTSTSPVRALVEKGLAEKVKLQVRREPFKPKKDSVPKVYEPTKGQSDALQTISDAREAGDTQTTLVYGVTGSGKTEVYLRSIADVLAEGKSAIALVPEISLTAHLIDAYHSKFGDQIAVLHSKLSPGERHDEWRRIESGEAKVVLGPRSAVFAPVQNLGLIVVDEEHETSYKQEHSPRYNARLAAEERARAEGAAVILGSATPSLETFYRASSGDIKLAVLDKRVDDRPLPDVKVVDMREEFEQGRRNIFCEQLHEAISDRLSRREQVILFMNRRGYASFLLCRTCGYSPRCDDCDISLTYHTNPRILKCHHCNETHQAPTTCPKCDGPEFRQFGLGTEKVEEEVRKLFPDAGVIRMDSDTTRKKNAHFKLLETFREGKADILVGTQMVAKGLDFHNVTLVGVITADTILNLPDFRAAERTFQLLTQVSGRAGRGTIPGEVIVQSFSPDHYAIRAAARQDYINFYGQEIAYRRELRYPPFSRLVNVVSSDPVDSYAQERLSEFARMIGERIPRDMVDILGPAPAPISRLKGLYRWHLILRDRRPDGPALQDPIREVLNSMPSSMRTGMAVDVDPLTML